MSEALWLAIASLLSLSGMGWLALAIPLHWSQVTGHANTPPPQQPLRRLGTGALGLAALACSQADRPSMALLVWCMLLTASALTLALILAWRPAWLRNLWPL